MGRFVSSGRGGRFGSVPAQRPKYISLPPPILRHRTPPLTPESTNKNCSDEEISFETALCINTSPLFSYNDDEIINTDNGWITPNNRNSPSHKNLLGNLTATSSPTSLQRLSPKYNKNKSSIWNIKKFPTIQSTIQITTLTHLLPTPWTIPLHLQLHLLLTQ